MYIYIYTLFWLYNMICNACPREKFAFSGLFWLLNFFTSEYFRGMLNHLKTISKFSPVHLYFIFFVWLILFSAICSLSLFLCVPRPEPHLFLFCVSCFPHLVPLVFPPPNFTLTSPILFLLCSPPKVTLTSIVFHPRPAARRSFVRPLVSLVLLA